MQTEINKIVLLFSLFICIGYQANCQHSNIKIDTITFKDGSYILLRDSAIVMNAMAKKISAIWKTDASRRLELGRPLLHNWSKLIGVKAASIFELLGPPDFYPMNEYGYEEANPTDSTYSGCRLTITFSHESVNYFWISCPP